MDRKRAFRNAVAMAGPMRMVQVAGLPSLLLLPALWLAGCGSGTSGTAAAPPTAAAATYFGTSLSAPFNRSTVAIDRTRNTFVQYQNLSNMANEQYIANSGTFTTLPDGILNLGINYGGGTGLQGNLYTPPQTGNWAVEYPGELGLLGLLNQGLVPLAPNSVCPGSTSGPGSTPGSTSGSAAAQTFAYVTLPLTGDKTGTAYGTFSLASSGSAVTLSNISQFNIAGGPVANPSPSTLAGTCAPTFFGQTISVPSTSTVLNPGNGQTASPSATLAIGPSGFLVEDNGGAGSATYQTALGAGSGALGALMPAAAPSLSAITAAQYTGFLFSSGAPANSVKNLQGVPAATRVASFGYPSLQTSCPQPPVTQTSTILYGGEFAGNNPAASNVGNCDFAIDFGPQDAARHGLFPAVTLSVGASFPGNKTGKAYSFPGAAVVGQSSTGKFAIFVVGADTIGLQLISQGQQSQGWGVYLLQAN